MRIVRTREQKLSALKIGDPISYSLPGDREPRVGTVLGIAGPRIVGSFPLVAWWQRALARLLPLVPKRWRWRATLALRARLRGPVTFVGLALEGRADVLLQPVATGSGNTSAPAGLVSNDAVTKLRAG